MLHEAGRAESSRRRTETEWDEDRRRAAFLQQNTVGRFRAGKSIQAVGNSIYSQIGLEQRRRPELDTEDEKQSLTRRTRRTIATRTGTSDGGRGDLAAAVREL
jgi:hypothetical protein